MGVEQERLLSLIEYAQQTARLRSTPASSVTQHGLAALFEHQVQALPGLTFDVGENEDEEIWLSVERRRETPPPDVKSALLRPWIEVTQSPHDEPRLRASISGASLVAAGTHRPVSESDASKESERKPAVDPSKSIVLEEYDLRAAVRADFQTYVATAWSAWAEAEKLNRRSIKLYAQLFTLKQQLDGVIVEAQLELAWGVGLGIWDCGGTVVGYPLVSRLVEIELNPVTAAIEVRPRDTDARLEVDWYASVDNPGVAPLEKAAREFFAKATTTFSPFDRGTYEGLLRSAATFLDAHGTYWPDHVPPENRALPKPEQHLKVTDTWVLFARPRTHSLFVQDLDKLKKAVASVKEVREFPSAVAALVTEPETENKPIALPGFRGVSAIYGSGGPGAADDLPQELYFPKPFNDEQVRIVQLLEVSDGVAVQGPPGTGKTHTIANIICHYLAQGKRVLVTSMKDPALAVLRHQLPPEIQPLAISLLTSEQEGMKQFEFAIQKIASEVQALDRSTTARKIRHLDETISALHGRLSVVDRETSEWAQRNLARVTIDGEEIDPQDAARELVAHVGQFEWIPDTIGIESRFAPQFSDADVVQLREARRTLGADIAYLDARLPQLVEFPELAVLLQTHRDLSQLESLKNDVASGGVPPLVSSTPESTSAAQQLLSRVDDLHKLREEVIRAHRPWTAALRARYRDAKPDKLLSMLETLGTELLRAQEARRAFIERPVSAPSGVELDDLLVAAIDNLASGKKPFRFLGLFEKSEHKSRLTSIRVLDRAPTDLDDWKHVAAYVSHQHLFRELAVRWNALAVELGIDGVAGTDPEQGIAAAQIFGLCRKVSTVVQMERAIADQSASLFPTWQHARFIADSGDKLAELERALRHHLTQCRLANVWAVKERFQKVLEGKRGHVVSRIQNFLATALGNPSVKDADLQNAWSALMAELSRVHALGSHLSCVREICARIEHSGASNLAAALTKPLDHNVDRLLPDNWRKAWRLKRVDTYLAAIDAQETFKKLAQARHEAETDLARAYKDVVCLRTWLKLAENASPSIRAALQAYLNAIQKIGKGTGKRAVRYRQNAREAAAQANPAVPCWIMPHYRVSESLPAELGCFDLVVIDEASQSDLTALPALLRADRVLIVGDDKQVSPEGVGLEEEKIRSLMNRFLTSQVVTYRPQMSPERSIYDLYKVVFAKSSVMLREHFRCVPPIIEYSKREFYNHELHPLRIPKASERLDPPLVDVLVQDGHRTGDINLPEARFIVDEIKSLVTDPTMSHRSIGVVSLLGEKQALEIFERLTDEIGPEVMERHHVACGDARTFQGKERDIMFLSMVAAPNNVGAPLSRDTFAQRFNVAASRARDRMYLVRSLDIEQLSQSDRLRRGLITHFATPFFQDSQQIADLRKLCESPFEREMYDELTQRGYWVRPQVRVGQYRIDLVVEGHNDARLAIECDGDRYHSADKWIDDMQRQRVLERAGWVFWRCFASTFLRRRKVVIEELLNTLTERGIEPAGAEGAPRSVHAERRLVTASLPHEENSNQAVLRLDPVNGRAIAAPSSDDSAADSTPSRRLSRVVDMDFPTLQRLQSGPRSVAQGEQSAHQSVVPPVDTEAVLAEFCELHGLELDDKRSKGGRLWVYHLAANDEVARQLKRWGFQFAAAKGFWRR